MLATMPRRLEKKSGRFETTAVSADDVASVDVTEAVTGPVPVFVPSVNIHDHWPPKVKKLKRPWAKVLPRLRATLSLLILSF